MAVKAGRVLDIRSGKYLERQIIWIEGDRIKQIGSAAELATFLLRIERREQSSRNRAHNRLIYV